MSRERSIRVRLRAEVKDFNAEMAKAAQAAQSVGDGVNKSAERSQTALGRMAQSARENRQVWEQVGTSALVAGTAIAGVGIAALNTGISYNTLQQTSRAALTTLLGSAQAANAQMDKLDDFASNSPFSKAVFIEAQQQLLGFGVTAERVVPILDAIQQSVAAVGGSNQDIAEITRVLAVVQSSGKITAETFNQLGARGVDAAQLIGNEWGMTAGQVRQAVTDGTVDAEAALTALTDGMQANFGGAADNVKETFVGATDRVKAAWRDLSSELAEPFVGSEGGGFLVDFLNKIADLMRLFQGLPTPVKVAAVAIAAVTAAALLAGGAFLKLTPRILANVAAAKALAAQHPKLARGFGIVGKTLGGAGGLIALVSMFGMAMGNASRESSKSATEIESDLIRIARGNATLGEALAGSSMSFTLAATGAKDFESIIANLSDPGFWGGIGEGVNDAIAGLGNFFGADWRSDARKSKDELVSFGQSLSQLAMTDIDAATGAFIEMAEAAGGTEERTQELLDLMPAYRDQMQALAIEAGYAGDAQDVLKMAMGELTPEIARQQQATVDLEAAQEAAQKRMDDWMSTISNTHRSFIDFGSAYDTVIQKNKDMAQATAEATGDAEKSWEDYYDGFSVTVSDWLDELEKQQQAQETWAENMSILAGRVNEDTLKYLGEMGPEAAPLIAELVNATEEELARLDMVTPVDSEMDAVELAIQNRAFSKIEILSDTTKASDTINKLYQRWNGKSIFMSVNTRTGSTSFGDRTMVDLNATGGLYANGIRKYATGGIDERGRTVARVPQIRHAAQGAVMWGERQAGWEAYISGIPGHEARNRQIWAEAGERLGVPVPKQAATQAVRAEISDAAIDRLADRVGQRVFEGSRRGISDSSAAVSTFGRAH